MPRRNVMIYNAHSFMVSVAALGPPVFRAFRMAVSGLAFSYAL
jgi:hypothetical protein